MSLLLVIHLVSDKSTCSPDITLNYGMGNAITSSGSPDGSTISGCNVIGFGGMGAALQGMYILLLLLL